jgi:hypothetical protein
VAERMVTMTARPPPARHRRSYGDDTLPTGAEALGEPLSAFPPWFLRMECARCGRERYANEVHLSRIGMAQRCGRSSRACTTMDAAGRSSWRW